MFHLKIIENIDTSANKNIYLYGRRLFSGSLCDQKIYSLESELYGAVQMLRSLLLSLPSRNSGGLLLAGHLQMELLL